MADGLVVYRFRTFEFDPKSRSLSSADVSGEPDKARPTPQRVTLPVPQAAILARLVSQPGDVVVKDALVEDGWPGIAVGEDSLTQAIHRLRKVLDTHSTDRRAQTIYIETVPQLGYRFAVPVERRTRSPCRRSRRA